MKILQRKNITYYIKDESIVVKIGPYQYIAYSIYSLQNRKPFYQFKKALLNSQDHEYCTIFELFELGTVYRLRASASSKPREIE